MANLRVATLNCQGLGMAPHRRALLDYLCPLDVHVYCLQEAHSTAADEQNWISEWGSTTALFHSSIKGDRSNGVEILLNNPDLAITSWHGDHEGRVLAADISVRLEKFHVTNIHAPQCAYTVQQRSSFFDSLYCYTY